MGKAIIFYTSKDCALCNEVEIMAEEISEKTKIPLYKVDIDELPKKTKAPTTCVITIDGDLVKDNQCFEGWENYENKLLELLVRV